jgi:hypothetical protein
MFPNIPSRSRWMIVSVGFFQIFSGDKTMLQDVIDNGFGAFRGDTLAELEEVIG